MEINFHSNIIYCISIELLQQDKAHTSIIYGVISIQRSRSYLLRTCVCYFASIVKYIPSGRICSNLGDICHIIIHNDKPIVVWWHHIALQYFTLVRSITCYHQLNQSLSVITPISAYLWTFWNHIQTVSIMAVHLKITHEYYVDVF